MIVDVCSSKVLVRKENNDRYYSNESRFLYDLQQELKEMGYDIVKKKMVSDGHMVDENQYYLRERNWNYMMYNNHYAIVGLHTEFNRSGKTELAKYNIIFEGE